MQPRVKRTAYARHGVLTLIVFVLASAGTAIAAPITYAVTGTVSDVISNPGVVPASITVGTPFSGTFSWDPATATPQAPPNAAYLWSPSSSGLSISLEIAGFAAETIPTEDGRGNAINGAPAGDTFQLGAAASGIGWNITLLEVLLGDSSGTVFDSEDLPTSLDLNDWDDPKFNFVVESGPDVGVVLGYIDTLVLVPEPSTAALLGLGIGLVALRRSRRRLG